MHHNFFFGMARLNRVALAFFIVAKITGLIGVSLGFVDKIYHQIGMWFLVVAFISIFLAISCSMLQMSKDNIRFSKEDELTKNFKNMSATMTKLQAEIQNLEARKEALKNLMIRRG